MCTDSSDIYVEELQVALRDMLTCFTNWWPELGTDKPQKFRERIDRVSPLEVITRAKDLVG